MKTAFDIIELMLIIFETKYEKGLLFFVLGNTYFLSLCFWLIDPSWAEEKKKEPNLILLLGNFYPTVDPSVLVDPRAICFFIRLRFYSVVLHKSPGSATWLLLKCYWHPI